MPVSERKILIIGTGGTIASEPTVNGYSPVSPLAASWPYSSFASPGIVELTLGQLRTSSFYRRIRHHPQLSDISHVTPGHMSPTTTPASAAASVLTFDSEPPSVQVGNNTLYPELRTPKLCGIGRVRYEIMDLDRHMDSSEMTPNGKFLCPSIACAWHLAPLRPLAPASPTCLYFDADHGRVERHCQIGRRALGQL